MNRRTPTTITVGRDRRRVAVEHRPLSAKPANGRRWSRGEVHEAGTIAVADALCPAGGLMTAERGRALDRLKRQPATIAEDVERILRDRQDFPRTLWGEVI